MTNEEQTKPVRIENYNGYWGIRTSPIRSPTPLLNEAGERMKAWPNTKESGLEFICSSQRGLDPEEFVRRIGGTHYEIICFGHLQVYRATQLLTTDDGKCL